MNKLKEIIRTELKAPELTTEDLDLFFKDAKWEEGRITYADLFKNLGYKLAKEIYGQTKE